MSTPTHTDRVSFYLRGAQYLRDIYPTRAHNLGYRYQLSNVIQGQADVLDDKQHVYRGTVVRCQGAGLSGHCEGKWRIFHTQLNRYIAPEDVTDPTVLCLAEFSTQELHGGFSLVFRTRHDAALCALLAF